MRRVYIFNRLISYDDKELTDQYINSFEEIINLKNDYKEAVEHEAYEEAAQLRDLIQHLERKV